MADLKISQFVDGGTVQTTDQIAAVRSGVNTKVFVGSAALLDSGSGIGDVIVLQDDGSGNPQYPVGDGSLITGVIGNVADGDKGDIVITGGVWNIDSGAVGNAEIRDSAGLSVIGRSSNTNGAVADITAAADNNVLRRSGTSLGWGAINLASADAVTGTLVVGNGGLGVSSLTAYAPIFGGTTSTGAVQSGTVGTTGQVLTSNGAGALPTFQDAAIITPFVAYTPTFTSMGTPTNVSVFSRRVGDCLHVIGKFTTGTGSGTEARMTLGFNGTNGGLTVDSAKLAATTNNAGTMAYAANGALLWFTLSEGGLGYVTFSAQGSANASLSKLTGAAMGSTGTFSLNFTVPITGW